MATFFRVCRELCEYKRTNHNIIFILKYFSKKKKTPSYKKKRIRLQYFNHENLKTQKKGKKGNKGDLERMEATSNKWRPRAIPPDDRGAKKSHEWRCVNQKAKKENVG